MTKPLNLEPLIEAVGLFGPVGKLLKLAQTISLARAQLGIPASMNVTRFLKRLVKTGRLQEFRLTSSDYGIQERIGVVESDVFDVALSIKNDSYFSHGTAVFLHGLTGDVPTTLYVNKEQSPKKPSFGDLGQGAVDRAFASKGRRSRYSFQVHRVRDESLGLMENGVELVTREAYGDSMGEVTVLSGKNTNALEVGTAVTPRGRAVPTTKLERTLIDIAVRPDYAGGTARVADCYKQAVTQGFSANTLMATLKRLDYKYPYHQAIGFYLDRAGADPRLLDRLQSLDMPVNFYLNYGIKTPVLDRRWKIYVPTGM